jgi:penicillin-binding protein 1A
VNRGIDIRSLEGSTGHTVGPVALPYVPVRPIARVDVERPDQLARRQAHARQHLQSTEWGRGQLRRLQEHDVKHPPVVSGERSQPEPRSNLRARPPPIGTEDLRARHHAEQKAQVEREQQVLPQPQQRETRAVAEARPSPRPQRAKTAKPAAAGARRAGSRVAARLLRITGIAAPILAISLGLIVTGLVHHVYFDRSGLPDLGPFIRFETPTIGAVYDARGKVLIELAREYRRTVSFDEVPEVLRDAILAAEDKNFLSHSGVDYGALPRVVRKTTASSLGTWWKGDSGFRLLLPHGGSTLTQQLVRGYFLQDLTRRENGDKLLRDSLAPRLVSSVVGVPATNKLTRKLEEVRLTLWLEDEMRRRYGSQEQAKREVFARYASFIYLGNGRYGFAAASEYYFGKALSSYTVADAGEAALLAGIGKCPRDYAPRPGDPRPLRRRNQILALMARNGYIPEDAAKRAQAEPIRVVARSPVKTQAPAAIGSVLEELGRHGEDRFGVEDLFQGRISVQSTVDERVQTIVNEALENGLALYEKRRPQAKGLVQGSVVVLRNSDAAILAETGGRQVYNDRLTRYSDLNRATGSLRQPGSAIKPVVYLAAFRMGLDLDTIVLDERIEVPTGANRPMKQIANHDNQYKGPMPIRQALAESRNAATVWITREIGPDKVVRTARELGIRTPLQPYLATALGASEVRLLELADAYRVMASGVLAEPHVIERVTDASGRTVYQAAKAARDIRSTGLSFAQLSLIQEGLRGVVRLPRGTAHSLDSRAFGIPVMGKTGTTSEFRDALFVGSTYGPQGITVAVRIGFDDNRKLGANETGGRTALPIFREIVLRIYKDGLVGPAPRFPREIEQGIDEYLALQAALEAVPRDATPVDGIGD